MIDTHRLRLLCEVADKGSFTAAAAALHFTQSAVSQQVAILEKEMGLALVVRRPRGVELTEAGQALVARGGPLLAGLTGLEQAVRRLALDSGRVRLGVFASAGAHLVPLVAQRYRDRVVGTTLALAECQPGDVPHALVDGSLDAGLSWDYDFAPRRVPELATDRLLEDPLVVLLPAGHPLTSSTQPLGLADLAEEGWVARRHLPPYDEALETVCRVHGFEPHVVFRVGDYASMQGMVAAGVGVGLAPSLSVHLRRPDLVVRPLAEPVVRRIDVLTLLEGRRDPAVRSLVDVLAQVSRELGESPQLRSWQTPASPAGGADRTCLASIDEATPVATAGRRIG